MDAADPHTLIQRALNQARQDSTASLARAEKQAQEITALREEREELRRQLMEHKKWVAENAAGRRKAEAALAAERKITADRVEVASRTVDAASRAVDAASRATDAAHELVCCVAECQAANDNGTNDDSGKHESDVSARAVGAERLAEAPLGQAASVVEISVTTSRDSATAKRDADAPSAAKALSQRNTAVVGEFYMYPRKPKADASGSGTAGNPHPPVKHIPFDLLTRKRKVDASASVDTQVSGMTRSGADLGRVLNNKRTKWDSDEDAYE
ncbi:hypothetical protein DFH07DRAFT_1014766 [Mycena maculata]|uniref:Uncharacterized protein n=1 Tax=Mycena maculata TaxID=230809 RepID=A0AAD7MFU0_9AGAR|nr:hypothetical protein DFH07DRAFT_1014766 [Mycena maculata]